MSRRGLVIRLLIFGPLFVYFGYGAYQKWRAESGDAEDAASAAAMAREVELKAATKSVRLQDGRTIDIVELTPEQAERLHNFKVPPADAPLPSAGAADALPDAKVQAAPAPEAAPAPQPAPEAAKPAN